MFNKKKIEKLDNRVGGLETVLEKILANQKQTVDFLNIDIEKEGGVLDLVDKVDVVASSTKPAAPESDIPAPGFDNDISTHVLRWYVKYHLIPGERFAPSDVFVFFNMEDLRCQTRTKRMLSNMSGIGGAVIKKLPKGRYKKVDMGE